MLKTTVMIPEDLKDQARRYTEQHGISLSDLIRDALRQRLHQETEMSRAGDSLFADQAVYEEDAPEDLAARMTTTSTVIRSRYPAPIRKTQKRWNHEKLAVSDTNPMMIPILFLLCIPAANLLIQHVGTVCVPSGPCLIPVWPGGLLAPSGVLLVGVSLVLRDLVQARYGAKFALICVAIGGLLSGLLAPPALAIASVVAYVTAEGVDTGIYSLLRERFLLAVLVSSLVGLVLDSALFLGIAFNSLEYLPGQIVGKLWAVVFAAPVVVWLRRRLVPAG